MEKEKLISELEELRKIYNKGESIIIPALWRAQEIYGYLSDEALEVLSSQLNITKEKLLQVATFYHFFHTKPVGKYHIHICTNISCMLSGAYEVVKTLKNELNVDENEITPDGLFSWEEIECIGLCDKPVAGFINRYRLTNLNPENIKEVLKNPEKYAPEKPKIELI
ncbi:MAG: NAD(P)H-dependent oxidoreductase subunit E [candidate division WOR-3 bacterium]|jgi:NADH:ubiquinone oxidoreductase subunit E